MHQLGACFFFLDTFERKAEGKDAMVTFVGNGGTGFRTGIEIDGKSIGYGCQTFGRRNSINFGISFTGYVEIQVVALDFVGGRMTHASSIVVFQGVL